MDETSAHLIKCIVEVRLQGVLSGRKNHRTYAALDVRNAVGDYLRGWIMDEAENLLRKCSERYRDWEGDAFIWDDDLLEKEATNLIVDCLSVGDDMWFIKHAVLQKSLGTGLVGEDD
ncbi:hypothetical protein MGU_10816 [Metarhizium guizhouense ARSEF 977]|uniref:Uncharacterized protein n=1 Tax=Metarhizium guizhouense (strain ARSEF 977) TaxID=1276136 RepID=A0A0B4GH73_METGA|nr:hypothetical protein MGU_10816 [Metarhizium guizhouense ARSEF 977]